MAIDTREKRNSAISLLLPFFLPGVVPGAEGIDAAARQASEWVYSGILAGDSTPFRIHLSLLGVGA